MLCLAAQALGLPGLRPTPEQLAQGTEKLGITDEHGPGLEALLEILAGDYSTASAGVTTTANSYIASNLLLLPSST